MIIFGNILRTCVPTRFFVFVMISLYAVINWDINWHINKYQYKNLIVFLIGKLPVRFFLHFFPDHSLLNILHYVNTPIKKNRVDLTSNFAKKTKKNSQTTFLQHDQLVLSLVGQPILLAFNLFFLQRDLGSISPTLYQQLLCAKIPKAQN